MRWILSLLTATCLICQGNDLPGQDNPAEEQSPAPRSAEASVQSIRLRPGFQIELVAAEPLVMDPIAIDFGPDGKLWVVEMADYPLGMDDQGKPGGRVRYLEDTDGDGRYDSSTLFLDQIAYPTGVLAWKDGVIVSAAPAIFFAADRDGDGKAEVREDLYRGFGEGNQQHRVNGFCRGLDNWLYVANGDSGGKIESVKTGDNMNLGGRDLRIRPESGQLDAQAGRTQFGRHRDDHGNWFGSSNPIPVRHYVLADHYLRRNPWLRFPSSRRDIARVDNTQLFPISRVLSHWSGYKPPAPGTGHKFTSACSTMVYRDDLLGDDFRQNTFTCSPVHNSVHRRRLIPDGVTFQSVRPDDESDREFLASTDSWFRPTTVTTGPDGALWVVDMYRLVIEHPEWIDDQRETELFLRDGHDRGRIYRVFPDDQPPRPILALGEQTTDQLANLLNSPNGRVRDLAQALLIQRNDPSVVPRLKQIMKASDNPLARLHAMCTLDGLSEIDTDHLATATNDDHPTVRRHAIRISQPKLSSDHGGAAKLLGALEKRCDDDDPHVRLQLAYSLGESTSKSAAAILANLARQSGDPYQRAAVLSSLRRDSLDDFYSAIQGSPKTANSYRTAIVEMAVATENPTLASRVVDDVLDTIDASSVSATDFATLAEIMSILPRGQTALSPSGQTRVETITESAVRIGMDSAMKENTRVAAIDLWTTMGKQPELLLDLLAANQPTEIQIHVVKTIAQNQPAPLLARFDSLSPGVRSAALESLIQREASCLVLMKALQNQDIPLQAVNVMFRQRLKSHGSGQIQSMANTLFGSDGQPTDREALIQQYASQLTPPGDVERGREIFTKQCAACHRVGTLGHIVGPDLAAVKNRSATAMLTAILAPNAAVEDKYRSYNILTVDGVLIAGVIADESSTAIEVRTSEGKIRQVLRRNIDRIQSTGRSLMPEEIEKHISPKQMRDLLAFLDQLDHRVP